MTISIDLRLAIQRLSRQGRRLSLKSITAATEEWQPIVEEAILRLLRTGEIEIVPTDSFIKVKAVPTTWRDDDTRARINRMFGGSHDHAKD